ncbi:MFS transporter [Caulobacter sp. 17J65-9]|uniref:MFS transporter n=1 Tax=Caulobacter sp. 17J65-9 TaxID=2709382 RepID=UPI0013C7C2D4|nr:MFS transporter [Caulobacter sp. 17J65-9]NEX93669.1 MFS transporter [Caulobacter sp. 17J65-9]
MSVETQVGVAAGVAAPSERVGRYRWVIVGLLFTAMVINYVDRQTIGLLKGDLTTAFGWSETDYADIIFYFQATYAVAYLVFGRIVDKVGARWGFGLAFLIWQVAHIACAGARSLNQFIAARMVLGVGEGGGFPGGIKAVAEWFPKKERAFATGLFNAGTNIGAVVTPLVIPWIVTDLALGWQGAFIVTGVAGLIWLPIWLMVYRHPSKHAKVSSAELAYIQSDPADPAEKVSWFKLLTVKETWAYALGKFLIDPIWWMFLFWLPDFLGKRHGLDLKNFGPPLVAIYLMSDVGSVAGGWLSSTLMKFGQSLNSARKYAMLLCALCAVPVAFAAEASSLWVAVGIIGLATAAHQGFSANLYTLPSDVFPRKAVGSVIGIGGMIGALGGMAMSKFVGAMLEQNFGYTPMFIIAATTYLVALAVVHWLSPRYAPAKI